MEQTKKINTNPSCTPTFLGLNTEKDIITVKQNVKEVLAISLSTSLKMTVLVKNNFVSLGVTGI